MKSLPVPFDTQSSPEFNLPSFNFLNLFGNLAHLYQSHISVLQILHRTASFFQDKPQTSLISFNIRHTNPITKVKI